MHFGLKDKVALVTGSTEGIGFAIVKALGREGATVYLNGRTEKKVQDSIKKLEHEGVTGEIRGVAIDLSTEKGAAALIKKIPSVDILVNNLGIYEVKAFEDITDADWNRIFEVNVMSGIRLSRHYLPIMKTNNWGRIIFISSESGVNIPIEMIHYGVTKTAQIAVARGLAETCAGTDVTVNSVLPGPTSSEGVKDFVKDLSEKRKTTPEQIEKEFFQNVRPSSIIKRFATTDEVASVVAFVCSAQASAVNGASVRAEGGVIRSIL